MFVSFFPLEFCDSHNFCCVLSTSHTSFMNCEKQWENLIFPDSSCFQEGARRSAPQTKIRIINCLFLFLKNWLSKCVSAEVHAAGEVSEESSSKVSTWYHMIPPESWHLHTHKQLFDGLWGWPWREKTPLWLEIGSGLLQSFPKGRHRRKDWGGMVPTGLLVCGNIWFQQAWGLSHLLGVLFFQLFGQFFSRMCHGADLSAQPHQLFCPPLLLCLQFSS